VCRWTLRTTPHAHTIALAHTSSTECGSRATQHSTGKRGRSMSLHTALLPYCPLLSFVIVLVLVESQGWRWSKTKVREARVIVRATAEGPMELALGLGNGQVIDRRVALRHEAIVAELPVLVAVRAEPVPTVVAPLVCVPVRRDAGLRVARVSISCPQRRQPRDLARHATARYCAHKHACAHAAASSATHLRLRRRESARLTAGCAMCKGHT
jgi:hypothetical protein